MRQPSEHRSGHLNTNTVQRARLVRRVLAVSIVAAFGHAPGLVLAQQAALPVGMNPVSGAAHLTTAGSQMTVINSPNAVLDWQSFSIGAGNGVHFQQDSAASKVLNRVVGNDPSSILGSLSSNGQVWLVNPNGVLFGAGARIDVGALVASTLGVSNADFLAGRHGFNSGGTAAGSVVNRGDLTTSFGGRVWLVGASVRNEGTITTPGGQIVLAAGQSIELVDSGMPNVTVRVSAPDNETVNLGSLLAPGGGSIDLHGAIVNQSGIVRADSVDAASAGRVVIRARGDVRLASGSIDAGQIDIGGNDVTLDAARLNANGAIHIDGARSITLLDADLHSQDGGDSIVLSTATISAGASELTTPNGRWLVYLDRITDAFPAAQLDALGYTFVQVGANENGTLPATLPQQHGVIVREGLNVRIHVDADRVYDGSTRATVTRSQSSDLPVALALQQPTVSYQGNFADKQAGAAKQIAYNGASPLFGIVTATGQSVYGARQTYVADVARAPVTVVQAAAQDKVYDATRTAILSGVVSGVVTGDSATLDGALGQFDSKHAGSGKTVLVEGASLAGKDGANYIVSGPAVQASITPRAIGNGGVVVLDKVYDGSRSATLADTLQGILPGDNVRLGGGAALFEDKNAGAAKTAAISGAVLAGADAANYVLDGASTTVASITPRRIEASAMTAQDKVYDGSRTATINGALTGVVAGDNVRLESTGLFDDRNVGAGKTVDVSAAGLTGADAANYAFSAPQTVRASITARPVASGALVVQDKVYDGTRDASVTGALVGLVAGDSVRLDGARGLFADKNAGVDKSVTLSGGALVGADARNYRLVAGAATGQASITARAIDIGGLAALDKVYDGERDATLLGTLTGILAGDNVTLDGVSGAFADKNAGAGKIVTFNDATLGGADARNYRVNTPANVRATITPRQLSLAGLAAQDKTYDGTRDAQLSASLSGAVAGDAVAFEAAGQFDTKNAGSVKTVAITGGLLGADAANYTLSMPATVSAAIEHRALEIMIDGAPRKEYDATTAVDLDTAAFALGGVVAGDTLAVRGPAQGQFDSRDAGSGKRVVASGVFEIFGADAANYRVGATTLDGGSNRVAASAIGNRGVITPATLVYSARPDVVVGALDLQGLDGTVTGFKGNDTLANATSGTLQWHTTATPASAPGVHGVFGSGLSAVNYVLVQAPANAGALDVRAGLPAGGPLQRAQDGASLAVADALQAAVPASCSVVRVWPQCDLAVVSNPD